MAASGARRGIPRKVLLAIAVAASLGLAATGCTNDEPPPPLPSPTSPTASSPQPGLQLAISPAELPAGPVDRGTTIKDASGHGNNAVVVAPAQGVAPPIQVVRSADAPGGVALKFGEPCEGETPCLREILEVADAPGLNPGTRDFHVSAAVRLGPDQTTKGSNIVQKGFSLGGGGQYKLQVDDLEGRPSCIIVAPGTTKINRVKAERSVADGAWHRVACRRAGATWSVIVDGAVVSSDIPAGIDVTSMTPLRIGGKSAIPDNDPFHGEVTDVQLVVQP